MKLCKSCAEKFEESVLYVDILFREKDKPWLHCHHDEEPKCETCLDGKRTSIMYGIEGGKKYTPNFCPECGRDLRK